jgi:Ca-activated chloride channel family protein
MKWDANDPRWTAYALGEIADEKERAEIESILERSAEMQRYVDEIRQAAGLLQRELQAEPPLHLTPAQRARIESRAQAPGGWFSLKPAWVLAGATAALLLAFSIAIRQFSREETASRERQAEPVLTAELKSPAETPELAAQGREKDSMPSSFQEEGGRADSRARDRSPSQNALVKDKTAAAVPEKTLPAADVNRVAAAPDTAKTPSRGQAEEISNEAMAALILAPGSQKAGTIRPPNFDLAEELKLNARPTAVPGGVVGGIIETGADAGMRRRMLPPPMERWHPIPRPAAPFNTEAYEYIGDNPFLDVAQNPLSTFSIDVDTASYSNVRRFLERGALPPKDAVRIEELVNYFDYDYKGPDDEKPFAVHLEIAEAPWKPEHRLLRIGLKGREIKPGKRPAGNFVFLLDVSGSMADENKLPLVKESMRLLVDQLTESDRVAIVVYASDTRLELPPTSGDQKEKLRSAIDRLRAGGSTNGAGGIQLAYQTAQQNFIPGGVNRVILATDGDFNVGVTSRSELARLIEEKARSGVYLSALGFGMGNYKDATLELLAGKGRGNCAYIDNPREAQKALVDQIDGTLATIARDVKIQVEFNPRRVSSYRLIGYEDRVMPKEDFNDDEKTAGAIGAGHAVTVLYELVPAGSGRTTAAVDPLKYQKPSQPSPAADRDEILTLKIRNKEPEKDRSVLSEFTVRDSTRKFSEASADFKFAAAVAAFGMVLRDSPHKGSANLENVLEWAKDGRGPDTSGYRREFIRLIHRALSLSN